MISPVKEWIPFANLDEKLSYMKEHRLLPTSATFPKSLVYTGPYVDKPTLCELVGYVNPYSCVLRINGELHCIHPDLLLEMQTGKSTAGLPDRYVVIDLETTGLNSKADSIIEIAAVKYSQNVEEDQFVSFVNPGFALPNVVQQLTGITDSDLVSAPSLSELIQHLQNFLGDLPLVAHNASFERSFLTAAYNAFGLSFENKMIDSLAMARKAFPGLDSYSLESLKTELSLQHAESHRALPDVYNTAELLWLCAERIAAGVMDKPLPKSPSKQKAEESLPDIAVSPNSVLSGKTIVFTGELSFSRGAAKRLAERAGAIPKSTVSTKTDYLVVGKQAVTIVGMDGLSEKEETARQLLAEKKANIQIIDEARFVELLEGKTVNVDALPAESEQPVKKENTIAPQEQLAYSKIVSFLSPILLSYGLDPNSLKISPLDAKCSIYFGSESDLFCRLRFRGKKNYIELPIQFSEEASKYGVVEKPRHASVSVLNNKDFCKLLCSSCDDLSALEPLFIHVLNCAIDNLSSEFGCCSRYLECSDAKKCVNPRKELALQCYYLKNLRKGYIFYGKNKIKDSIIF